MWKQIFLPEKSAKISVFFMVGFVVRSYRFEWSNYILDTGSCLLSWSDLWSYQADPLMI